MMTPEVLALLERGGQVICANARAARDLRHEYTQHRLQVEGRSAWATPAILDWHSWLATEWHRLLLTGQEQRLLLSPLQEETLWAEIVRPVVETRSLLSAGAVARMAQRAHATFAAYGGSARLSGGDWHGSDENAADLLEPELFRGWANEVHRVCKRRGWLSPSDLPSALAAAYRLHILPPPAEVGWRGFDRVTPLETQLRLAMQDAGCAQHDMNSLGAARQLRVAAQSIHHEMETCARWIRDRLQQNPDARIAVLVHDLPPVRAQIDRIFRRILMPGSLGLRAIAQKPVYEFTLGMPLGDVPLVRAALLLLQWIARPLDQTQIRWLMTSGFLGESDSIAMYEAADSRLSRQLLPPEESLDDFLKDPEQGRSLTITRWMSDLRRAIEVIGPHLAKERSCRQWVASIDGVLATAGWPGTRVEDSVTFQVREHWQRILDEVTALDISDARWNYEHFLERLAAHVQSSIFAAASEHASVSITGIFESAGQTFDAIWMLQTTDENWPARSSAQPMLPAWLQRELHMPAGDVNEDRAFSLAVMERLRASANDLIFSYALEGSEGAQRPSKLIDHLPEQTAASSNEPEAGLLTEPFEDDGLIAWTSQQTLHGGQRVLKLQAACPFQAFASSRLGGKELRSLEHGLDALTRGSLIHVALEGIWSDARMTGSTDLRDLIGRGQLDALVQEHAAQAIEKYRGPGSAWEKAYLALEHERLCDLLIKWLQYEAGRAPFNVEGVEVSKEIDLAGLRLTIRMDRIDATETGRILIDYKTGKVKPTSWQGERLDEPQLPLYAVAGAVENLTDVAFAQLRAETREFFGAVHGDDSGLILKTDHASETAANNVTLFREMQNSWRQTLVALSTSFQMGVASVDPKSYPKTCEYCAYGGLCRVAEMRGAAADEDAGSEDDEA